MNVFDSRKLLTVGALLVLLTLVVHGAGSKETAVVSDLSFNSVGHSVEVNIATTEHARYTYFELSNPRRLVVDFHGIRNNIGFKERPIDAAGVERVRTSYFTDRNRKATRIVFDLAENVPYRITDDGENSVRVLFGDVPAQPAQPRVAMTDAAPAIEPEPAASSGPAAGPSPSAPAFSELRVPLSVAAKTLLVPETPVDPSLARPLSFIPRLSPANAAQAPAPTPPPAQTPPQVSVTPQLPGTVTGTQVPAQQYTGEIVSIDVKDTDLKDFFRFIADISGLNIVLDPAVSGTVTLTLNDVPWDQALDIVLRNNGLGSELQGNVLRIARKETLLAEENARKALRDAQETAAELSTKSYQLNYTKADQVSLVLTKVLSSRGSIIQDIRGNALIVSDIPNQFTKIDNIVNFLDRPAQQVEIEARLLSANKSFSRELGSQLAFLFGNKSQNKIAGAGGLASSPFSRTPTPSVTTGGSALPLNVNLPAAGTSGISFLLGAGTDVLLDEIITAAEAKGTAKLLSRPKVATQNNQAATVSQGTQIPVQTNQNNTVSVQFLNFSLRLTVTPQITAAGTILMNVQIENSQPDFARAVNGVPSVATQAVQTSILMGDGETAVVGGILIDTDSDNLRQVPGFGSIPVIGHLFKNTSIIKSTAELLFFITPRIQTAGNLTVPSGDKPPGQQR